MKRNVSLMLALILAAPLAGAAGPVVADEDPAQAKEKVEFPGTYVRLAYNEEGWVTLGFRLANESIGQKWMLLEVGMTVLGKKENYTLNRSDISLVAPGPKVIPLATQKEYGDAGLVALNDRADIARDSINYFPADANRACALSFFTTPGQPGPRIARDVTELSWNRACAGRLYFNVPEGIQYGTYNLDVKIGTGTVRVPFEIMTKEGVKKLEKELQELKKEEKEEKK
jgi:hypothetical protein